MDAILRRAAALSGVPAPGAGRGPPALRCAADGDDPSPSAGRGPRGRPAPARRRGRRRCAAGRRDRRLAAAGGRRPRDPGADRGAAARRPDPAPRARPGDPGGARGHRRPQPRRARRAGGVPVPHPDRRDRHRRRRLPAHGRPRWRSPPRCRGPRACWACGSCGRRCRSSGREDMLAARPLDELPGDDVRPRDRHRPDLPRAAAGAAAAVGAAAGRSRSPACGGRRGADRHATCRRSAPGWRTAAA